MEANEAPGKIYINPNFEHRIWLMGKGDSPFIEYANTDTFIEKALTYLHDKLHFDNVFYGIVSTDFNSMEEMYEDFVNYMKGE